MKIALVVPDGEKDMNAMGGVARPPLGVCYLKSHLNKEGFPDSKVFHQVNESNNDLAQRISEYNSDIVGFSIMSFKFPTGSKLAEVLKNRNPNITTVFGGGEFYW